MGSQIVLVDDLSLICRDALSVSNLLVELVLALNEHLLEVVNGFKRARQMFTHSD